MQIDGTALRVLREKDGWPAGKFAQAAGISAGYLSDIEAGRRTLDRSPELITRMAELLHAPRSMLERRAPGEQTEAAS